MRRRRVQGRHIAVGIAPVLCVLALLGFMLGGVVAQIAFVVVSSVAAGSVTYLGLVEWAKPPAPESAADALGRQIVQVIVLWSLVTLFLLWNEPASTRGVVAYLTLGMALTAGPTLGIARSLRRRTS